MRTRFLFPLAFAITQTSVFAAPQAQQADAPLAEIQVRGVAPTYQLQPQQIDELKGTYALDNGTTLKVTNVQRRLFAQLDGRARIELLAVGEHRFVAPGQRMTMEYRPVAFGDEIVLTYPSDLNVASAPMVTVRLALSN